MVYKFIRDNPTNMDDDWGYPYDYGNLQMWMCFSSFCKQTAGGLWLKNIKSVHSAFQILVEDLAGILDGERG